VYLEDVYRISRILVCVAKAASVANKSEDEEEGEK
jgi:hypothetical protein